LGVYGRWVGVNWVWSYFLTIYHAVYSIAIPIMLVELLFPDRRDEPWIGRRGIIGLSFLLIAVVIFGYLALTPYRPPTVPYQLSIVAVIVLYWVAKRMPYRWGEPTVEPIRRPFWFALMGFGGTLGFFIVHWFLPEAGVPVLLTTGLAFGLMIVVYWAVRRMSNEGGWSDRERLALVSGALTFFILLAPLSEFDTNRTDNPAGMMIVGFAAAFFLLWLLYRTELRLNEETL
jgi:hypothetical protein